MVVITNKRINELVKKYHENKLSHAFLFVTNDLVKCNKDVKELIKAISCPNKFKEECEDCNICYQIENNVIPNIKEIYPDGQFIKKNQILELKEAFMTKPLYIANNIYIINNADKLNSSSANTMLKFLEEPDANIIGFFITNNKESMLETIKSRCQIIIANYDELSIANILGVTNEEVEQYEKIAVEYLQALLISKIDGLLANKQIILANIQERQNISQFYQYLYLTINQYINNQEENSNYDFLKNIEFSQLVLLQKLLYNTLESLSFNVNIELLMDNFVLGMEHIL